MLVGLVLVVWWDGRLVGSLVVVFVGGLVGWIVGWSVVRLGSMLAFRFVDGSVRRLVGGMAGVIFGSSSGRRVRWLFGSLRGWRIGWWVGLSVRCLFFGSFCRSVCH